MIFCFHSKYFPNQSDLEFVQQNDGLNSNSNTISRINSLRNERNDIDETLAMTHSIISMGGDAEMNLQGQGEMLKSTKKKQGKYISILPEINMLIRKIE